MKYKKNILSPKNLYIIFICLTLFFIIFVSIFHYTSKIYLRGGKSIHQHVNNSISTVNVKSKNEPNDVPGSSSHGTIYISRASQLPNARSISIRTVINNLSDGVCYIIFTKDGFSPVQQTSLVESNLNYYQCGILDVSVDLFPIGGEWNLKIFAKNRNGIIVTNTASLNNIIVLK